MRKFFKTLPVSIFVGTLCLLVMPNQAFAVTKPIYVNGYDVTPVDLDPDLRKALIHYYGFSSSRPITRKDISKKFARKDVYLFRANLRSTKGLEWFYMAKSIDLRGNYLKPEDFDNLEKQLKKKSKRRTVILKGKPKGKGKSKGKRR